MKQLIPLCLAALPLTAQAQEPPCRLALAMALDISSSVNEWEYDIQLLGLVEALRDPEIQEMILAIPGTQVQAMVYEWSGYVQQDLIVGWTRLSTVEEIDAFADRLSQHWRIYSDFPTAIGKALEKAIDEFDRLPVSCAYSVVDISGDGVGNDGPPARDMWPALAARGITVNALVIAGAEPDPVAHYRENVITGPGAFLIEARNGFEDYPALIRGKLLRELAPQIILSSPADHR